MTGRASPASSLSYQWTYDVFLNFRGEDTRKDFVGNLFNDLRRKGIRTFMDDEELRKGEEITPSLFKAIAESRMAITVFSKNYASSMICLDELVKILECIKGNGRLVWPIFYGVEPSDVRHQKRNYEEALVRHKKNFKANDKKAQSWKLALRQAANLCGSHFNTGYEYEYQFIEKIVNKISSEINRTPLDIPKYPVGLESRVLEINHLLGVGSNDEVIMIGICGIGGMGKSTIARAVYNSIADQFEGLCFLHDIKENSSTHGLKYVQERMLSKTLGVKIEVEDVNEGVPKIKRRFNKIKILLILDNVDKAEQLEKLAGNCDWFGSSSRIIITTRNKHLLARHEVERLYQVERFNDDESIKLLSWNAFKMDQVDPSYMEVSNCVVNYAKGLPLALEVIGSNLFGKSIEEWKSAIDIYRRIPNEKIHKILKVSYDDLGEVEQEIFLDIASFFRGKDMKYVKDMVQHTCGFDPSYGIGVLMDKCLINYYNKHIEMHDLIRDMGREIVRQESPNEPGKRSRLWNHEDIVHVLGNNTGTDKISCIIQDNLSDDIKVNWDGKAFKEIKNLKILIIKKAWFSEGPKYLPNSLRVLQWPEYPSSYFRLVKKLENLSVLDLRRSQFIVQIPDVSGCPNLRELRLEFCENLIEIHNSVGHMEKLKILSAFGCAKLRNFPGCIRLPSLQYLNLQYCISLEKFPKELEEMEHIIELDLSQMNLELPCSILNPTRLRELVMGNCRKIELDHAIEQLHFMQNRERMYISLAMGNISDELLSMYLTSFTTVEYLDLSCNNFTVLPACIKDCVFLRNLYLNDCKHMREIMAIPPKITVLEATNCTSLNSRSKSKLLSQELHEDRDKQYVVPGESIPNWFGLLSKGSFFSFWFRDNVPMISLCFVVTPPVNKGYTLQTLLAKVIINGKEMSPHVNVWRFTKRTSILADHILCANFLKWNIFNSSKMNKAQLRSGWNHVEVYIYTKAYGFGKEGKFIGVKKIGINEINQGNRWKHIRFSNPYEKLWGLAVPEEIKFFLWKAHHHELAIEENLAAKGINMDDNGCPHCGAVGESIMHTLVACPFAEVFWSMSPLELRPKIFPQASFSSWWEDLSDYLSYHQNSKGMLAMAGFICWMLWKCRKEDVFNIGSMETSQVTMLVMQQVNEFRDSFLGTRVLSSVSEENDIKNSECLTLANTFGDGNKTSFSLLYAGDTISSKQDNHQKNNSASDCLSLQAPLDKMSRASVLDLPGSNSDTFDHQGLQQQHSTSINLQQMPKSSENENVRKVKGKDIIVYRRKRRRIH